MRVRFRDRRTPTGGVRMTLLWFLIWLTANTVGGREPLEFDPVNIWAGTLILAVALDLNRPRPELGRGSRGNG
jgi:hypothetical protein